MKNKLISILLLAITLSFGQVYADSGIIPETRSVVDEQNYKPHIGLAIGVADPEGSSEPKGNYALTVGFQPYIPFSVGLELGHANFDDKADNLKRTSLLVKGKYNFGGDIFLINKSYIGAAIGPAWEDEDTGNEVALAIKHEIGFDYPIASIGDGKLYLGANLSHLMSTSSAPGTVSGNGVVTYWY